MAVNIRTVALIVLASAVHLPGQKDERSGLAKNDERDKCALKMVFPYVGEQAANPHEQTAKAESPHWYTLPEWWLLVLGIPTLSGILWQANESRRAATAAENAAKASLLNTKAFIHSQRPWLSIEVALAGPLIALEGGGIQLSLRLIVKNHGQMPALATNIFPIIYLPHPSKRSVTQQRDRFRNNPGIEKRGSNVIFPNTTPYDESFAVHAHSQDIEASTITFGDGRFPYRYFDVNVIVIVWYRSTIDDDTIYQTAVTYSLARNLRQCPPAALWYKPDDPFPTGFEIDQTVPREALIFFNTSTIAE